MPLSLASANQRLSGPAACNSRYALVSRSLARSSRRPCKPVCFKEDVPDRIDDTTTGRRTHMYGTEPVVSTGGVRDVNLGPVASVMYPVLQYGTIAAAAAALLAPDSVSTYLFRTAAPTTVHRLMIMSAGAALIPTIVSKRLIKFGADNGIVATPTHKLIVSACLLHGVMGLVVLSQAVSLRNPVIASTVGSLCGLATITTAYTLMKIRESGQLVPSTRGLLGGVLSLLTPRNLTAAAFSAASITLLVVGTLLFTVDPTTPSLLFILPKDAVHVFCARITGAATLANAVLLFAIKRGADNGRAGAPLFRTLSAGLATYAAITAGLLAYARATGWAQSEPAFWGLSGGMAAVGLLCGYIWGTSPK